MLFAKSFRPLTGRIGQLAVAPDQLEWRANLHLHLTFRQPFAAQFALGEVGPNPLDGAGKNALDGQRGGLGQGAIGVEIGAFVHRSSPSLEIGGLSPGEGEFSNPPASRASSSRSSRSSTSNRTV